MRLAETDHGLKDRAEEAMLRYRGEFEGFVEAKTGSAGGQRRITIRRGGGHNFSFSSDDEVPVDLSEMPLFQLEREPLDRVTASVLPDLGLLACFGLLAFAVSCVGFLRQEVGG
jgi:hypothetical protein